MAKVKVGCKLLHGLVIEMGVKIDERGNVSRTEDYAVAVLAGANQHLTKGQASTAVHPPGVTLVDEELITAWLEKNKGLGFVKAGMVYVIKNEAEGKAIALDLSKMRTGFEPLRQDALPKLIEKSVKDAAA